MPPFGENGMSLKVNPEEIGYLIVEDKLYFVLDFMTIEYCIVKQDM